MSEPLIDVTGARQRREQAKRRRRVRFVGLILLLATVVAGGYWAYSSSPLFTVEVVEVEGTSLLTPDEVLAAAQIPMGSPLAQLDVAEMDRRLNEVPAIARVEVERIFPRTVVVKVTERTALVTLASDEGYLWVDATGTVFRATPERPPGTLLADVPRDQPELLARLAIVAPTLPPEVVDAEPVATAPSQDSITITLNDKRQIIWGSAEDSELKARVIVPLLSVKAKEYDVSAPTHPTTR